jgi:hypothetical protein
MPRSKAASSRPKNNHRKFTNNPVVATTDSRAHWKFCGKIYIAGYELFKSFYGGSKNAGLFLDESRFSELDWFAKYEIEELVKEQFGRIPGLQIEFLTNVKRHFSKKFLAGNNVLFVMSDKNFSAEKMELFILSNGDAADRHLPITPISARIMTIPRYQLLSPFQKYNVLRMFHFAINGAKSPDSNPIDKSAPPYLHPRADSLTCTQSVAVRLRRGKAHVDCPPVADAWKKNFPGKRFDPMLESTVDNCWELANVQYAYPDVLGPVDIKAAENQLRIQQALCKPVEVDAKRKPVEIVTQQKNSTEPVERLALLDFPFQEDQLNKKREDELQRMITELGYHCEDGPGNGRKRCLVPPVIVEAIKADRRERNELRRRNSHAVEQNSSKKTTKNASAEKRSSQVGAAGFFSPPSQTARELIQSFASSAVEGAWKSFVSAFSETLVKRLLIPYLIESYPQLPVSCLKLLTPTLAVLLRATLFNWTSAAMGVATGAVLPKLLELGLDQKTANLAASNVSRVVTAISSIITGETVANTVGGIFGAAYGGAAGSFAGEWLAVKCIQKYHEQSKPDKYSGSRKAAIRAARKHR